MSMDELKRFSADVKGSEDLKNELKKLGTDEAAIVKFAQGKGYNFSNDDLKQAKSGSSELSDKDLDNVAGGWNVLAIN